MRRPAGLLPRRRHGAHLAPPVASPAAADDGIRAEEIAFDAGDVNLNGTLLLPRSSGPAPAVVLVHGAGPGRRHGYRAVAEVFARAGVVALIYDKRTKGYAASGLGERSRSYPLLAADALAAVRFLRERPEVDPEVVGLWGISEGGWVVPLAAAQAPDVAFAVLVSPSGLPPASQHAWNLETTLRHKGVLGSLLKTIPRTAMRLLVGAGLFAESGHDPVGPLTRVSQPVLAVFGGLDRVVPPDESARLVADALTKGGNRSVTLLHVPGADHGLRASPDGFRSGDAFAPGYVEAMVDWLLAVAVGAVPPSRTVGPVPEPGCPVPALPPLARWESPAVQLAAVVGCGLAFAAYPAVALARRFTAARAERHTGPPLTGAARTLAGAGLAGLGGTVAFVGLTMSTAATRPGPAVAGRPLAWVGLQGLAATAATSTAILAVGWVANHDAVPESDRFRIAALLAGGALFGSWAAYWGLLFP